MDVPCEITTAKADKAECEKKLGKPPSVPPQPKDFLTITDDVFERLRAGRKPIINEKQLTAYEDYWIGKLECLDKSHTARNRLNLDDSEQILQSLINFSKSGSEESCPHHRDAITECFSMHKGETLKCDWQVKSFVDCIDKLLYDAIHVDSTTADSYTKKTSYAERFERGY